MAGIVKRSKYNNTSKQILNNVSKEKEKNVVRNSNRQNCTEKEQDKENEDKETEKEELVDRAEKCSKESFVAPEHMELELREEEMANKTLSTITTAGGASNISEDGTLTVIQKSQLMNWAEENFFSSNKIMTQQEAVKNTDLHQAICRAIEIKDIEWAVVGTEAIKKLRSAMSDRLCLHRKQVKSLYMVYLRNHQFSINTYAITKRDCALTFRAARYDSGDEVVQEKWRLIGQCLAKVCSKRCTWSKLEVRAAAPNVCNFTTFVEEAIVYWLFVSEGDDWINEFEGKGKTSVLDEAESVSETAQRKKCGQHKTITFLKHWWQLRGLVKVRREKREISEDWDDAWRYFASEELEMKTTNKNKRKRTMKDVLPTYEDVLGVGESSGNDLSNLLMVLNTQSTIEI